MSIFILYQKFKKVNTQTQFFENFLPVQA